jgi:hypothetical protein
MLVLFAGTNGKHLQQLHDAVREHVYALGGCKHTTGKTWCALKCCSQHRQPLLLDTMVLAQAHLERRQGSCDCCCCGVEVHLYRLHRWHEAAAEQEQQQGCQSAHARVWK